MGDAGAAFDADGNACSRTGATAGIGESTPSYRIIFNDMKCKLRGSDNSLILLRILFFFYGHDAHRNPIRITQITFVADCGALCKVTEKQIGEIEKQYSGRIWGEVCRVLEGLGYDVSGRRYWP